MTCAEIGSPPGGEEDRLGPYLIGSTPQNESVQVPSGNTVKLFFSEPIQKPAKGTPVFVSPRQSEPPEIKWKKDQIIVTLADDFSPEQTYIVTVSSAVTDWRNNRLDSATIIAFSTGEAIDTGNVSGHLTDRDKPVSGAFVALYSLESGIDSLVYDSIHPDYLATTNTTGRFSFRYLPDKEFRLVSYIDKNRDERLNPFREPFAVPDRAIMVGGKLPLNELNLRITKADTLVPAILSVSQTANGLLRVRLSKPVSLEQLRANPHRLRLIPADLTGQSYFADAFAETDMTESDILTASIGSPAEGSYQLDLTCDSSIASLIYDQIEMKKVEDQSPPTILSFQPGNKPLFSAQANVRMVFSEPLDTTAITEQTFVLWQSDTRSVPLSWHWSDRFHLQFDPQTIKPGQKYRLDVTEFDLVDLSGDLLGDSLTQFQFSTLGADSLGSISGEVTISLKDRETEPVMLNFMDAASKQVFDMSTSRGQFTIDLPAGKYLLSGFIDSDRDGKLGNGSLIPFRLAETEAHYQDTISVRARFETAGILFEFR